MTGRLAMEVLIGICYIFQMATKAPNDPTLKRFRAAVNEIYGSRVARVVLFGSRARGDARPDSDYDIAVFLREMSDRFAELHRLADVSTAILYDTGEVVNALPFRADTYNDPRMPLMHEIRGEGVDL
jgi:predicted nucleotidyltransferase